MFVKKFNSRIHFYYVFMRFANLNLAINNTTLCDVIVNNVVRPVYIYGLIDEESNSHFWKI